MGKFRGMNQKAAAAAERKAATQQLKDAKAASERERELQKEWTKGTNARGQKRAEDAALKADEATRKRREKAALLAEEEGNFGKQKVKKPPTLSKKKGKKKNDLSILEDALVSASDKKVKAKRQADRIKRESLKIEQSKKIEEAPVSLMTHTQSMIAGTEDELVGRAANKSLGVEYGTGIDGALNALDISDGSKVPSRKALYKAFEERKMTELKEEYPTLKMSQYKDKIFNLWKKSPENPANIG